jgi:peptide/nickel transport system permease protein
MAEIAATAQAHRPRATGQTVRRSIGSLALAGSLALGSSAALPLATLAQDANQVTVSTATGDLGTSFRTREPVTKLIGGRVWPSLKLVMAAMAFAICVGVTLGFLAALKPGSMIDTVSMVTAISGLSLSQFWFGLMLMYLFALTLNWLPSFGYGDGGLRNPILPAIALGVGPMALLARTTRAAVLDVLNADFVRTARSKGMSESLVVKWHVLRNALVLVITIVGLQFGSLMVDSVFQRDMPAVQGCILMIVLFFLLINTLVDLAYVVIDPRIRYG